VIQKFNTKLTVKLTKIQYEIDGKTHSEGGEFKADNAFSSAPPGFLDYAKEQWSKFNIQKY